MIVTQKPESAAAENMENLITEHIRSVKLIDIRDVSEPQPEPAPKTNDDTHTEHPRPNEDPEV